MGLALAPVIQAGRLHDAVERGDSERVQRLLEEGADIDARDEGQATALHYAAYEGRLAVVRILLDGGAAVNPTGDGGFTPLHVAVVSGHAEIVRALLEAGARVDPRDSEGLTPLGMVGPSCDLEITKLLIDKGANVNARFHSGATILHGLPYAKHANRHRAMAELLVSGGADVDAETDRERNTPLDMAAMFGNTDVLEVLLAAGADVHHVNSYGKRPLHSAAIAGQAEIVALLLAHGAEVDAMDQFGMTALHMAASRGEIKKGRNMQEFLTWRRGGTPLPHDYLATAQELIDHGASPEVRDKKGRTAAKFAKKRGSQRMIALLEGKR
jgi:ankyrin repeat protein